MPYIPSEDRLKLDEVMLSLEMTIAQNGISNGEYNYIISSLSQMYLDRHGTSYNTVKDVVGGLECAKLEFYRRIAAPYEDTKIAQNGDVYDSIKGA